MTRVLIAVPQANELQPLLTAFERLGHPPQPIYLGSMQCFSIPSLGMIAAIGGHGKTQFALQSQYLINRADEFTALLCVGAAGSLTQDCRFGDVVVATSTVEHDYKIRFVQADVPCHRADPKLLDEFRKVAETGGFPFGTHFGPVASGDEDIVDQARARELKDVTGALCVAWEGSGGARAAAFNGLGFLEIRCITDSADPDAPASFRANCAEVIPNVADLLVHWRSPAGAAQHAVGADR